jgi:hypothetical protein
MYLNSEKTNKIIIKLIKFQLDKTSIIKLWIGMFLFQITKALIMPKNT